jgi:signal transduction histidine kinase
MRADTLRRAVEGQKDTITGQARDLLDARVRLAALDRAKTDFLRLISHELRTPLNGVLGVGEILLQELPPTTEREKLQEMYQQSRDRMLSVVDDALLLSQINADSEKFAGATVAVGEVLRHVVSEACLQNPGCVELEPGPGSGDVVLGHKELLVRAFDALIEAAIKLSCPLCPVIVRSGSTGAEVRVEIEEHGTAIPKELIPGFFEVLSFGEAQTKGLHVGLRPATAGRILTLFGGSIQVTNLDSCPGAVMIATLKTVPAEADGSNGNWAEPAIAAPLATARGT